MTEREKINSVLFVCMGNICRSPAAEGVFSHLVQQAGRADEFEIDSAATHGYHIGHQADARMRAAARSRGYELHSISRRLESADFDRFDLIVVMDDDNYHNARSLDSGGGARLVRMTDYCIRHDVDHVPDPYYGGEDGFYHVLDILEDACAELLRRF